MKERLEQLNRIFEETDRHANLRECFKSFQR